MAPGQGRNGIIQGRAAADPGASGTSNPVTRVFILTTITDPR